ncbi:MAG: TolC family protein [Bacteroidales bacterium]|nr:TolC family protein [Bacteroidales bacterium]
MKGIVLFLAGILGTLPFYGQESLSMDSAQMALNALMQQSYTSHLTLSLADAQNYAIQQNRTLKNASLDVRKAHAQRWQTIAAMLPQADASAQYVNMCNYEMEFGATGQKMSMPNYLTAGASVSMGLNGQAIVGALINNIAIEMQDITRNQSEADLAANVTEGYAAVLVMQDIVVLMDSSLRNVERLYDQTARMAAVGAVEQTQADQVRVRVNQLHNSVMANRRNLELAYNTLRVLLDVDAETELQLTTSLDQLLSPENALGMLLEQWNINNNFNYQLLQKNVELAKKNVHMAAWAYGPTIGAQYTYTYRHNFTDGGFNMTPPNMIAVNVALPIWSSGKRAAGVTEKKIALQQAENTLSETTDNLGIQYQQLRYNLANAYETYITQKENIEVSSRVFANVGNKYHWGASSALELTNASNDLITAQTSYVNSVLELVNAQVKLEKFLNNK